MKSYGRRRYSRKTTKRRTQKKCSNVRGVTAPVKRYINRSIHRNLQNKTEDYYAHMTAVQPYINNTTCNVFSLIPYTQIFQGVGEGDRIGDTIRTRRLIFKYTLYPAPQEANNNPSPRPQEVMIFIGKVKNSKPIVPVASDFARLFQQGDTYTAPFNNLLDTMAPINKNWWNIVKIIRHKVGYEDYRGSSILTNNTAQFFANNDFKLNAGRSLNLTKFAPKVLKFNDTTQQPTNDGLFAFSLAVQSDGVTPPVNYTPVFMDFTIHYEYENA